MNMEKVKFSERVEIVGTGASRYMPKGTKYSVHPLHAKHLVESKKATYDPGYAAKSEK